MRNRSKRLTIKLDRMLIRLRRWVICSTVSPLRSYNLFNVIVSYKIHRIYTTVLIVDYPHDDVSNFTGLTDAFDI